MGSVIREDDRLDLPAVVAPVAGDRLIYPPSGYLEMTPLIKVIRRNGRK